MIPKAFPIRIAALLLAAGGLVRPLAAQEAPARRLSSIVGVAVEEYGKAVDARGRLLSDAEYQEASDFLKDAAAVAQRLSGDRADRARAMLDSLIAAVAAKATPARLDSLHARFTAALGAEGALELPKRPVDLAEGRAIYAKSCVQCHGALGMGDGPMAKGMTPAVPAIGDPRFMHAVKPALMYRIISVGVAGTAMPAYGNTLSAEQRWGVVAYVNSLRSTEAQRLAGEGLYLQSCASCHGTARGPGAYAASLTRLPPEIGALGWQAERSDSQIAHVIRAGIPGTAMPPNRLLGDSETSAIVAYVRARASAPAIASAGSDTGSDSGAADAAQTANRVITVLDQALAAARDGRMSDAGDRAFDAYIAFEPLEGPARAKNPGLVATMERYFADFKGSVKGSDLRGAERARNAIEAGLPSVVELTRPTGSGWTAFLQSFLIILREGFEAILVIGAVVAFLIKTGHRERLRSIWVGVAGALVASFATAVVLATVLKAMPASREIIEGATLLIAVGVLFSVSYWLISKVEAAKWQAFIREKVTEALSHGGGRALAVVAFLAVYREGAETALFYQALFNEGGNVALPISLGIAIGFVALAIVFVLFYRYGVKIPLRPFFAVTSALLYYMAFVFIGKGVRELQEGNVLPITALPGWPHVEALGIFPSLETLLAQLVLLLLFVFAILKTFWPKRSVTLPTVEPAKPAPAPPVETNERLAAMQAMVERLQARVAELESASEREAADRR